MKAAPTIGQYLIASGLFTVSGTNPPDGNEEDRDYIFQDSESMYGGTCVFEPEPINAVRLILEHIDKKRKALGIDKARDRILYDMKMRRDLI